MPFFSIIIPTYNRAQFITNTILSVINQTLKDFEIIIVDDGSTDDTSKVIQPFLSSNISYYKIQNSERGFARNYGASKSSGEWLCFLDSDDILYPHHLENAYKIIIQNSNIQIFSLGFDSITFNHNVIQTIKLKTSYVNDILIKGNPLGCQGVFIKKILFEQFKFNEDRTIAGLEDWELWLRIAAQIPIAHFPIVTSAFIQHQNRSVLQIDKNKWIKMVETFIQYITHNKDITNKYQSKIHQFYCSAYTYLSLHLSFDKRNTKESFYYLIKGLKHYPLFIFQKRFYAIIRNLLLHLLHI